MGGAIGAILPFALAVAIAPVPIIAEILLLFTSKPKATGGAFLGGFVIGLAVVATILVVVAGTQDLASTSSDASTGAGGAKIAVGALLIVAARRKFKSRPAEGEEAPMPKWMDKIDSFTPVASLGTGAVIGAANPKNIAMSFAAAVVIAQSGATTSQEYVALAVYVVLGAVGVAAPFVVALAMGDKATEVLNGWKAWLAQNNTAVMAVLFLVFGVVILGQGISGVSS